MFDWTGAAINSSATRLTHFPEIMNSTNVQIGWLVLNDAEQRRARDYLRQFRDEGTLDELGFAQVRDALADVFFPATNTIMISNPGPSGTCPASMPLLTELGGSSLFDTITRWG